ncbi:MFS transporter [Nesterenkonia ebinurensis]|uniref:MFS transporter n=1 Tax=Nesterenkonia ebinurensis TaxID=2608252 RepID=UPI00123DC542|nr:MFS transporter [Nesterenkonia ebinurensis]
MVTRGSWGPRSFQVSLIVAVVLIGLTLRGPIVGIPPLLSRISADFDFSPAVAGLVTSVPLMAFAVISPFVAVVARRVGVNRSICLALVLLGAAILVRPWIGGSGFLMMTAVVGIAITIGNVLLPVVVRRDGGPHIPKIMAASVSAYGLGQGLVAAIAVPLALLVGWRWSSTLPCLIVAAALIAWLVHWRNVQDRSSELPEDSRTVPIAAARSWGHVWRQGAAWWLAIFFGMQALLFYTASTWSPQQLVEMSGVSESTAGSALSGFHILGIGGTLLVPKLLEWLGGADRAGLLVAGGWFVFFLGLFLVPQGWPLWMFIGGWVQGAGIGLGITLIAIRPVSADYGRHLSGMVQCVGYSLAALGPVVIGWLLHVTAGWAVATGALLLCAAVMGVASRQAGSSRPIG